MCKADFLNVTGGKKQSFYVQDLKAQSTVSYSGAIQETSVHSTQQAPAQDQLLSTRNVGQDEEPNL